MMVQNQPEKKKRKRKKLEAPKTKKKKVVAVKEDELGEMNADDFMASFDDDNDAIQGSESPVKPKPKAKKKSKKTKPAVSEETADSSGQTAEDSERTPETVSKDENIPKSGNVKKGLSRLGEKDSDFFKFLQENDPDLLDFSGAEDSDGLSGVDSEDEIPEDSEDETENVSDNEPDPDTEMAGEEEPEVAEPTVTAINITPQLLKKWKVNLEKKSLPTWKQLVRAFQAAVVTAKGDEPESEMKYTIVDPDIVNKVIMMCLKYSSELLKSHLGENPTSSTKWNRVKMSLKSYLTSLTELLGLLTSNDVLCAVMRHCKAMLPYYAAFSRLIKKFVKSHVVVWGSKSELSRVVAFTCLQAVVKKIPTFLEDMLKKMYVEYTKCSKMMNPKSRDNIMLMRNSLVEMFKINPSITYTTGFLYIRQLAVTLRSVIVNKKEVESVYNWQYVNCLHVWVSVLSDCDACLQPLIFPLIQVMMGVIKLHSSPCFYPLHLHSIRLMLHLAAATNKHIPLVHSLLGTLDFCAVVHKAPATKPVDLTCVLRVTKGYKKTKAYQDGVFDLTYELLLNYISQLSQSISFPEVSFPVIVWLRKFNKKCNNPKYTSQMKQLLEKMDAVSRDLTEKRASVSFTPKDLEKVTSWESQLPESALTKYFNTWLKIHRAMAAANKSTEEEEEGGEGDEEDVGADDSDEGGEEPEPSPKKKAKKSKKSKTKDSPDANGIENVNSASLDASSPDKKKKKKTKKVEEETKVEEDVEFVDTGDMVEDIVLSD